MAEDSRIEWTHSTFSPWLGCQKVGPGCDHCYAEAMMDTRLGRVDWGPHGARRRTSESYWQQPLKWDRAAAAAGERRRVFCASLADVFDNHVSIPPEWRADLWALIRATPNLDWMQLTKRPGNIARMLPPDWDDGWPNVWLGCTVTDQAEADRDIPKLLAVPAAVRFLSMEPLLGPVDISPWLRGCFECGAECGYRGGEHRPPEYERCYACGHEGKILGEFCPECGAQDFVYVCPSCGGQVVQYHPDTPCLDLVIVGGESGPGARPMHPDWVRSLRDQCQAAGAAFNFKQWGKWAPSSPEAARGNPRSGWISLAGHPHVAKAAELYPESGAAFIEHVGKKRAGRRLDGRIWDQMPEARHG